MEPECTKNVQGATNYCIAHGGRMLEYFHLFPVYAMYIVILYLVVFSFSHVA